MFFFQQTKQQFMSKERLGLNVAYPQFSWVINDGIIPLYCVCILEKKEAISNKNIADILSDLTMTLACVRTYVFHPSRTVGGRTRRALRIRVDRIRGKWTKKIFQ